MLARRTRGYTLVLGDQAEVVVRFSTGRPRLSRYSVVLRVLVDGEMQAVQSFDNTHDRHDQHRYTRDGTKLAAETFCDGTPQDGLNQALLYVAENWRRMIEEWPR